ncbi:MAG: acylglycerol kinase family protein [Firmicutes bacterium]|nr:acylglycerol kinase family protein [Bacillota bacterium]
MKVKIILNPRAGRGKAAKLKPKVLAELAKHGCCFDLEETQWHGHAIEIAKKAVESGYDLVIAAGGDGTVNQVVNGMAGSKVPLGVLSAGTGNDFAAMIGMPDDPAAAPGSVKSWKGKPGGWTSAA